MRLLNTASVTLHEFHGHRMPPYVILSHTWEQEEVSFEDIQSQDCTHLAGYEKIIRCCELAASQGWEYVWIDTCCIDKRSSAELSEAINSIFRWYREAQVCYTYLSDVVSVSRDDFFFSRWFTRGWTLQELLAPGVVIFVNAFWEVLDTKRSLRRELSSITGISQEHLSSPMSASIATKMSWASYRETTRLEDIAYCLLGLFDVNMPLLYGEGDKAFMRLQHEIVKVSDDESIFAWCDSGLAQSGLLARSPAAFAMSGSIVPVKLSNFDRKGLYTVTNRGVAFEQMALLYTSGHDDLFRQDKATIDYLAPLKCAWSTNTAVPIGLVLRGSIADGTMSRVLPWELQLVGLKKSAPYFMYRNLFINPTFVTSGLSESIHTQTLLFQFHAAVGEAWSVKCAYNGALPADCWWKGWDMKLQPNDLPDVLRFMSANGDCFFLIIRHNTVAPRIDLYVPPPSEPGHEKPPPSLGKILELYNNAAHASEKTADNYCCLLQGGPVFVGVCLSKECIKGRVRFSLDVGVMGLNEAEQLKLFRLTDLLGLELESVWNWGKEFRSEKLKRFVLKNMDESRSECTEDSRSEDGEESLR
ncbi:MAG: hypothetical protein L6R41_004493 [Letrouitia leprolyta]|nr:MAG: hypothetical protein L6R41_004493 [Letrouitia leprolyta]